MLIIGMIDDESASLEIAKGAFQALFRAAGYDVDVRGYTDASVFLDSMQETKYDLLCSDIIMEPMNGIELAKRIRAINKDIPLIFISSNENKVFSCFEFNPIGFIRKTNFFMDAQNMVKHYISDILPTRTTVRNIEVKSHGDTMVININDVMYIESNHNYQVFHIKGDEETVQVRKLMSDLEDELSPYGFLRVHKGFLVNYAYIYKLSMTKIILKNQQELPVSRQNYDELMRKYMKLTQNLMV